MKSNKRKGRYRVAVTAFLYFDVKAKSERGAKQEATEQLAALGADWTVEVPASDLDGGVFFVAEEDVLIEVVDGPYHGPRKA